jgi:alpha-aminoadipate carrier protein LysW
MATCPDCEFDDIDLDEYEEGDTLSCPECGRLLVLNGEDLDFADDDDDLDDDDDDEEEEDEDGDGDDLDEEIIDDETDDE